MRVGYVEIDIHIRVFQPRSARTGLELRSFRMCRGSRASGGGRPSVRGEGTAGAVGMKPAENGITYV
jgi:hypothetical protein